MYGSVFGAIRAQGPLPWGHDVDVGIRREQFLEIKKTDFLNAFTASGLKRTDHLYRNGVIGVIKPGWNLGVDIFTFYDYDGIMNRPGWATWLLFVHFELHHTFPSGRWSNLYIKLWISANRNLLIPLLTQISRYSNPSDSTRN